MHALPRKALITAVLLSTLTVTSACGGQDDHQSAGSDSVEVPRSPQDPAADATDGASPSVSGSPSAGPSASASASGDTSTSPSAAASTSADDAKEAGQSASGAGSGSRSGSGDPGSAAQAPSAPDFPVPTEVGDATQLITVKASGSYATVTAWAKGPSGWKAQFSTSAGRVGSNGVTDGSTRRQGTYTTPTGTYTITEGFGHVAGGTAMPYHVVTDDDWWVEDPESKFYNSMHGEAGADFPLTESGDRGSEHLINYPTQYAKALVINFNRWPATPGRGAGIFLHVNGNGATAGCVSVPRATMDRVLGWITPSAHPRIAIG